MKKNVYYNSNRYAALLQDLLETNETTTMRFELHFRTYGMSGFFENIEILDVPDSLKTRLLAIRDVFVMSLKGLV